MNPVLHASRTGLPPRYDIVEDGAPATTISARVLRRGGDVEIDGSRYTLSGSAFGRSHQLSSQDGRFLATAQREGLTHWTIEAGGRTFRLGRDSEGIGAQVLAEGNEPIGRVRKVVRGVEADLPGLDRPTQLFVLLVVLASNRRRRRAVAVARA
ncbi:hypothetical protein [Pseudonocardia spinosispora]|uniref:hypothetical protein n=1 Tax=Pseudonocardia spinosispora TaxID=103441 RepID=UPI00040422D6|nr:hypothetical protein [Pseudonocardia spinosispora]